MNYNQFRIICLDKAAQVPKIVKAVYNSIPHELVIVKTANQLELELQNKRFDLCIVNRINSRIALSDVQKIRMTNSEITFIIIEKEYQEIENWFEFEDIKFLTSSDLVQKLPLFLGESYSKIQTKYFQSFNYLNILTNCLKKVEELIILVDVESHIIFLNESAENLLGIYGQDYSGLWLIDYMIDGKKIWNYIVEKCLFKGETMVQYGVTLIDAQNVEYPKQISVKKLDGERDYFLIESCETPSVISQPGLKEEYELLNKFADSIANELINPVNIISGRLQLLEADLSTQPQYAKSLATVEKQLDRINETMSKLLTFARLKQDTIPQKINLNDLFKNILLEPSILRLRERSGIEFSYRLAEDLEALSGLISHFELLIKTLLEISFACLGNNGRILVESNQLSNYLNQKWITFKLTIDYAQPLFTKEECLTAYLGKERSEVKGRSIEATIIRHIIRQYHGIYQLTRDEQHKEMMTLLFPLPASKQ